MHDYNATGGLAISASVVTADLLNLKDEFERLASAGVDSLHIDVEDGTFVPVMNLGTRIVEAAVCWGKLPIDVHLMVADPERTIQLLEGLPLRTVAFHVESTHYPRRVLGMIREQGWLAGLAFNPTTPLIDLTSLAPYLNNVLMLTTEPERVDATFLDARLDHVRVAVEAARPLQVSVTVDGGASTENIDLISRTGVTTVVVGRALFASPKLDLTVARMKKGDVHE